MTRHSHALPISLLSLSTRSVDIPYRVSSCLHSISSVVTMRMCCPPNTGGGGGNAGEEEGYQPRDPP